MSSSQINQSVSPYLDTEPEFLPPPSLLPPASLSPNLSCSTQSDSDANPLTDSDPTLSFSHHSSESASDLSSLSLLHSPSFASAAPLSPSSSAADSPPAFAPPPPSAVRVKGSAIQHELSLRADSAALVFSPLHSKRHQAKGLPLCDLLSAAHDPKIPSALVLHTFPVLRPSFGGSPAQPKRRHEPIHLTFESPPAALAWRAALSLLLRPSPPQLPLLILVNPFGGTKQAPEIMRKISFVFRVAEVPFHVKETQHAGHALEFVRDELVLGQWAGVVTISGDGLLWEVINGLARRPDWRKALDLLPVGVIPGGSGNGLAAALGNLDPLTAAYAIAKGWERPMDLVRVCQAGEYVWSFLSINWAMISDIDFESEAFRWMGGARFTVSAVARVLNMRTYRGRIMVLPCPGYPVPLPVPQTAPPKSRAAGEAGAEQVRVCGRGCGRCWKPEERKALQLDDRPPQNMVTPQVEIGVGEGEGEAEAEWITLEGRFVLFCAANVSHISYDAQIAPYAHLSDGAMDVIVIRKGASKPAMTQWLLGMEDGTHLVGSEIHEYYKASSVILEPEAGMIGLDGERTPNTPVVCSVFRGALRLLGSQP